jgi:hypothetical protein
MNLDVGLTELQKNRESICVGDRTAWVIRLFNGNWYVRLDVGDTVNVNFYTPHHFATLQEARLMAIKLVFGGQ